jgi:hypothetical protein
MKLDKNMAIIGIILIIIISTLIVVYIIINENRNNDSHNKFLIETPFEKYSASMSSTQGFPFKITCNNDQKVTIIISNGFLLNDNGLIEKNSNAEYTVTCNQTVYWNFMDKKGNTEDIKSVTVHFKSSDKSLNEYKITLERNNDNVYYILEKK